jgi:hypothetical protein
MLTPSLYSLTHQQDCREIHLNTLVLHRRACINFFHDHSCKGLVKLPTFSSTCCTIMCNIVLQRCPTLTVPVTHLRTFPHVYHCNWRMELLNRECFVGHFGAMTSLPRHLWIADSTHMPRNVSRDLLALTSYISTGTQIKQRRSLST